MTLRLIYPDWQAGGLPCYRLGAQLLEFLAPPSSGPTEHITTASIDPTAPDSLASQDGVVAKTAVLSDLAQASKTIAEHAPDRIVTLGGDCLVSLPSFTYLANRYGAGFGVLWIDAHPDVSRPETYDHAHAYPVALLLREGSEEFVKHSPTTAVGSSHVLFAGMHSPLPHEQEFIDRHGIATVSPAQVQLGAQEVRDWIRREGITHLAVHIDLDVLDEARFHSLYFSRPDAPSDAFDGIARGKLSLMDVAGLLRIADEETDVVGVSVAEYLPWDALNLQHFLASLPLLGQEKPRKST